MTTPRSDRKPAEPPKNAREVDPVPLKVARNGLGDLVNAAAYGDRITPISRRGKVVAALIGVSDLRRLRATSAA